MKSMESDIIDGSFRGWNLRKFVGVYLISSYYFISIPHLFSINDVQTQLSLKAAA